MSQPIQLGPALVLGGEIVPKSPMPQISEFSPQSVQYASSSSELLLINNANY